ncbi:MAG: radical SAM protein [Candidatus Omnitrophica bacterium]|nr:radical SAM protein [Candidatus Omnitrophota bacterium]
MPAASYAVKRDVRHFSLYKKNKSPFLRQLTLELTERCNLDCIHCYINLPAGDRCAAAQELSTETIKRILREAAALGCLELCFTGGEPLLRKDFETIYVFAREHGFRVVLFTNATLISPRWAKLFREIPTLGSIEVTVYGMSPSSYEAVTRTPGSFAAARRGIDLLLRHKVPFLVKGALLPSNKAEVKGFERWSSSVPGMDHPPLFAKFFDLRCRRDAPQRNAAIMSVRLSPEEVVAFLVRKKKTYLRSLYKSCRAFKRLPGRVLFRCPHQRLGGWVSSNGHLQICAQLRRSGCVYDLKKGNLAVALKKFFPSLMERRTARAAYLARCGRCFLSAFCMQCPGRSWMEHGTLDTPIDYYCGIAHAEARYWGLIRGGEKGWEVRDWKLRLARFCRMAEKEWANLKDTAA